MLPYNSSQVRRTGARVLVDKKAYWWRGAMRTGGQVPAICVNPLSWREDGAQPATTNSGSLPFPTAPFGLVAKTLAPLTPTLTGATCRRQLLDVDVPWSSPSGFHDKLSLLFGSYHLNDYGLFYAALRRNADERAAAWTAAH